MTNQYYKTRIIVLGAIMGLQGLASSVFAATLHTIDVLGIYSDHVAQRIADPEALFVSNIEYANKTLQNSGANYRYNLVHVQQQNWSADSKVDANELISMAQDPEIQALREQYGADLVAGMVPTGSRYCGIAYVPSANSTSHSFYYWASRYAYSLSGDTCGGRTMTHEIGHNMGLGHSPVQGSSGSLATWGRGWGVSNSFVTVMAYESAYGVSGAAGRVQLHSNPDLSVCQGQSCGNPIAYSNGANATLALNLAAPQVENWMPSVVPPNNPPVTEADTATVDAGDVVVIDVLSNDSDPEDDAIALSAVGVPENGSAVIANGDSQIVYTPNNGFFGDDSFVYTVMDAKGATAQGSVTVEVNEVLPAGPSNLVLNGDVESGTDSWAGWWGTAVAVSAEAHTGENSLSVIGGRGAAVKLNTPFEGGREFTTSGFVKAAAPGYAYVYLRLNQGGAARYWFVTALYMLPNEWVNLQSTRVAGSNSTIDDGELLFYFPYGVSGQILIDDVVVE